MTKRRGRSGLGCALMVCAAALLALAPTATAKQVVTGHAEIRGAHGSLGDGDTGFIFRKNNMAEVNLECFGSPYFIGLKVHNLENHPIYVTYGQTFFLEPRFADKIDPGDSREEEMTDPDVGITDLSHKFATINADWGLNNNDRCIYASHAVVHFPDGTPLNGGGR